MMKIRMLVITVMLATVVSPGFAQVNYDQIRAVLDLIDEVVPDRASSWGIHDEEDSFTRTTRRYVQGVGAQGLLFIIANCESLAVLSRDKATIFGSDNIDSIWDDGDIVEHEFDDRDSMLVSDGTDWRRLLTGHDALRVRVTMHPEAVASDEFDLQRAFMADAPGEEQHVRVLFSEIGCAFE